MARLAGHTPPEAIEDTETTFAELQARIAQSDRHRRELHGRAVRGLARRARSPSKIPNAELKFSGLDYCTRWAMPNFYFHMTMAYAILAP